MYLQRGATVTLLLVKEVPMSDKHGTQLSISQLYGQVLQYMIWHDILPTQSPEKEQVLREQLCNRIIVSQLHSSPLNKITIHESTDIAFNPYRNICETQTQPTNRL